MIGGGEDSSQRQDAGFIAFERGVLQDNIILCDAKAGVLLAFSGAMVLFCLDNFLAAEKAGGAFHNIVGVAFLISGLGFLISCHLSLTTVLPRLQRSRDDLIFWESSIFKTDCTEYVARMKAITPAMEEDDMLRHLHLLAGICRTKFLHFMRAIRCAQAGFILLILSEFGRILN